MASVKIINIDGVGIYGVISLEFLILLQNLVNFAYLIQDLFDLAFSTSSDKKFCIPIYQAYHSSN